MIDNLNELLLALSEGQARVEFTKIDGTHRSMLCTKNIKNIPVEDLPQGTGKKIYEHLISVYDLEKHAWRSITSNNIISWAILND